MLGYSYSTICLCHGRQYCDIIFFTYALLLHSTNAHSATLLSTTLLITFFGYPKKLFWNSTSVFLNNVRVEQAPSAFVMGVIIAVAICIYYSQPSSQYISSWEGKRRQQIELFLHFAVGRTERRRRRSHAVCFQKCLC